MFRSAFPDLRIIIEDQVAEGDKVVTRWRGSGTHQGDLFGIAPTGNRVSLVGITINRIEGGKVAEEWQIFDALGMMQQLGAIPSPGEAQA
jgi:predicted ester cyclase